MGNYWKCKNCGKINMDYVGTCACGGLKSDGEAATEEEYKNQVPEKDIPPIIKENGSVRIVPE